MTVQSQSDFVHEVYSYDYNLIFPAWWLRNDQINFLNLDLNQIPPVYIKSMQIICQTFENIHPPKCNKICKY